MVEKDKKDDEQPSFGFLRYPIFSPVVVSIIAIFLTLGCLLSMTEIERNPKYDDNTGQERELRGQDVAYDSFQIATWFFFGYIGVSLLWGVKAWRKYGLFPFGPFALFIGIAVVLGALCWNLYPYVTDMNNPEKSDFNTSEQEPYDETWEEYGNVILSLAALFMVLAGVNFLYYVGYLKEHIPRPKEQIPFP